MRKIFANNQIMISAATSFAIVGIVTSICLRNFSWFARFGSVITAIGIIVFNRYVIVGQDILPDVKMAETGLSSHDPEHYRRVQGSRFLMLWSRINTPERPYTSGSGRLSLVLSSGVSVIFSTLYLDGRIR
jgi:hypothetical protein